MVAARKETRHAASMNGSRRRQQDAAIAADQDSVLTPVDASRIWYLRAGSSPVHDSKSHSFKASPLVELPGSFAAWRCTGAMIE